MSLERKVLGAIVSMCRSRVIARARLRPSEEKTRFSSHINLVISRVEGLGGLKNKTTFVESMKRLALHLSNYVQRTQTYDTAQLDAHLIDIIDDCCILSSISNWKDILLVKLNTKRLQIEPGTRQAVVDMVEKLAQYSDSSKTLVDASRRYRIVRKASVVAIRLGDGAFRRNIDDQNPPATTARQAFSKVMKAQRSNISFDELLQRLSSSEKVANKRYKESLTSALQNSRVHAEMQLIGYLNSHPSSRQPRIIASHKDACYLCNEFAAFHGMYTIPRSHGRLYPCWRLPNGAMKNVREGFVQRLESLIVLRANVVLSGTQKHLDPRESTLNSTVTSLATTLTVDEAAAVDEVGGSTSDAETVKPVGKSSRSSSASSSDIVVAEDTARIAELGVSRIDLAEGALPTAAPTSSANDQLHSLDDASWQTVEQGRTTTLRLTPTLRIHVEYSCATQPQKRLKLRTHELSATEMAEMDASSVAEPVYDVHGDLPPLQDVLCRANCRSVCLQMKSASQQRTRRFRVELG